MTAYRKSSLHWGLMLAYATIAFAHGDAAENRVSVNRQSFNPTLGDTVSISVAAPESSRISIEVMDRDGKTARWLAKDEPTSGQFVATWNGRDLDGAIVPDEAYSFRVSVMSGTQRWTYFPASKKPRVFSVQARRYSRRDAALLYELPTAARIHAQAGSATVDDKTKSSKGLVLKTLVNREPRPAGAIVESWNGFDESGEIYVPDLPQFVTAILATELPENSVIAFGNRTRSFLDLAAAATETLLRHSDRGDHHRHQGLHSLDDVSPTLRVTPLNGTWDDKTHTWMIQDETLRFQARLEGPTASRVGRQPGKVLVFLDYVQVMEQRLRQPSEAIELRLPFGSETSHVVSVNWQSDYGPLAPNSIRVALAASRNSAPGSEAPSPTNLRKEQ